MIFGVYAIKDIVAEKFMQPMFIQNDELAKRMFNEVINNTDLIKNNPVDFIMYKLSMYNSETGIFYFSTEEWGEENALRLWSAAQVKAERGENNGML